MGSVRLFDFGVCLGCQCVRVCVYACVCVLVCPGLILSLPAHVDGFAWLEAGTGFLFLELVRVVPFVRTFRSGDGD